MSVYTTAFKVGLKPGDQAAEAFLTKISNNFMEGDPMKKLFKKLTKEIGRLEREIEDATIRKITVKERITQATAAIEALKNDL